MYLLVSLLQLNALVVGNGSYILWPCGHDLHSLTGGTLLPGSFSGLSSQALSRGIPSPRFPGLVKVLSEGTPVIGSSTGQDWGIPGQDITGVSPAPVRTGLGYPQQWQIHNPDGGAPTSKVGAQTYYLIKIFLKTA